MVNNKAYLEVESADWVPPGLRTSPCQTWRTWQSWSPKLHNHQDQSHSFLTKRFMSPGNKLRNNLTNNSQLKEMKGWLAFFIRANFIIINIFLNETFFYI